MEEDLVLKEGIIYVLKDEALRVEIIWLHHDIPIVGHREKIENNRIGNKELLVASDNERCRKVHRGL